MKVESPVCGVLELRDDGPGWAEFWPQWANGVWEPYTLHWLRSLDLKGRVFVDVGAWIGPVSFWAYCLGADVVAIEPDRVAFDALWANIEQNGFGCISAVYCAVATDHGSIALANREFGNSSSRIASDEGRRVPCDTLPSILDYLDIAPSEVAGVCVDVEGYEHTLMPALGPWLEGHGIPYQVEPH